MRRMRPVRGLLLMWRPALLWSAPVCKNNRDRTMRTFCGSGARPSVSVSVRPCSGGGPSGAAPCSAQLAANAVLPLVNLARYLLDQQIAAQARAFETDGGFTEGIWRRRLLQALSPNPPSNKPL